ncbi:MAG: RNA methyltransferase [Tissierellia bacterium]|nr:RNA methyltransferase [Tissierellia bacterium]
MINSVKNGLIKEIVRIKKRNGRDGLIFLEGERLVSDSILGGLEPDFFVVSENYGKEIKTNARIVIVSNPVFKSISDTKNPQGIAAVLKKPSEKGLSDLLNKFPKNIFLLDRIQDPGNLGAIIRSADAFGLRDIILSQGTVDPYNTKVLRATMGSIFRVSLYKLENSIEKVSFLKEKGYKTYGAVVDGGKALSEISFADKNLIVIGNEANGISEELLGQVDEGLTIEMKGTQESLNAAVAASIIMYSVSL